MAGSSWGTLLQMTTWGESHGKGVGVVIDGCPAGLPLDENDIQKLLDRRKPGQSKFTTQRQEADEVEILSGVFEGQTTGTPIAMLVRNTDQRSHDYSEIMNLYRPGHADYVFDQKYGIRDYRGGGRSSGRETIGRVVAGAVAKKLLDQLGVSVNAYTRSIGEISINLEQALDLSICGQNRFYMPDQEAAKQAELYLEKKMGEMDSVGGVVECLISGAPAGLGEPVFEKLDANLGKAIMSIGAVKGFEIGDGFASAQSTGSYNNDSFLINQEGDIQKETNHSGGILGGISDGSDILFRAAFKPTPSIAAVQKSVTQDGKAVEISIKGRHDPIIVPRAVVVVEAMAAFTIADMLLIGMSSKMTAIKQYYK